MSENSWQVKYFFLLSFGLPLLPLVAEELQLQDSSDATRSFEPLVTSDLDSLTLQLQIEAVKLKLKK
jgi:hypothetical protein